MATHDVTTRLFRSARSELTPPEFVSNRDGAACVPEIQRLITTRERESVCVCVCVCVESIVCDPDRCVEGRGEFESSQLEKGT